ncbi:MAG TPA: LysM domain-containing protein [Gammaproteobacteria bacterium]|nr:LysM domain-containing protein [Gammaproteobacteria bacterium]
MSQYTVRAGDTLGRIAVRLLGDATRWREIAGLNALADPDALRVGQVLEIPDAEPAASPPPPAVAPLMTPAAPEATQMLTVQFSEEDGRIDAALGERADKFTLGNRYRKGLFRRGSYPADVFLRSGDPLLRQVRLSDSEINVLLGVSENEGALDAINTWDNSFLSFGMFQWTAGAAAQAGELPALLARVQALFPAWFDNYWGQFGLAVDDVSGSTGWFVLDGKRLVSAADKTVLREPIWALRFARAGSDRVVQAVEVLHAISRLDGFYFRKQSRFDDHALADLVTSEYGVALLLDNHVNRPGYVDKCVAAALAQLGLSAAQLDGADTETERQLLAAYLQIRETFGASPMTDARKRAAVTTRYLDEGILSDARDSFVSNRDKRQ